MPDSREGEIIANVLVWIILANFVVGLIGGFVCIRQYGSSETTGWLFFGIAWIIEAIIGSAVLVILQRISEALDVIANREAPEREAEVARE